MVVDAPAPRLETERLLLRRWDVEADLDAYAALCADPEVMRYIGDGDTRTRVECAEQLMAFELSWTKLGFGLFAAEPVDSGELVGFVGLAIPDFLPEIMPAVEIGWRLSRTSWGKGYATEAARAVLAFSFDELGFERLVSVHVVGNDASGNVMKKIGMHLDRETTHPRNGRAVRVLRDRPSDHRVEGHHFTAGRGRGADRVEHAHTGQPVGERRHRHAVGRGGALHTRAQHFAQPRIRTQLEVRVAMARVVALARRLRQREISRNVEEPPARAVGAAARRRP